MGIVCVEDYLLGHFSESDRRGSSEEYCLKSMLILGLAGARVAVTLQAIVSLLLRG